MAPAVKHPNTWLRDRVAGRARLATSPCCAYTRGVQRASATRLRTWKATCADSCLFASPAAQRVRDSNSPMWTMAARIERMSCHRRPYAEGRMTIHGRHTLAIDCYLLGQLSPRKCLRFL